MRLSPYYPSWYLSTLGRAFRLDGRYEEAIAPLNRALERDPNFLHPHAVLAVIYSELGREQDARAKAADILEIDPGFTIREFSKALPYKHSAELDRIHDALRKAGLPECPSWVVCHEYRRSKRRCATVREMKEGPSGSAIRS